jgi:hypothetical protein
MFVRTGTAAAIKRLNTWLQVVAAVDRDFSSFGEVISSMFIDKNSYVVHFSTLNNHLFRDRLRCTCMTNRSFANDFANA